MMALYENSNPAQAATSWKKIMLIKLHFTNMTY